MAAGGFRHALPQSGIPIGEARPRRPPSESESRAARAATVARSPFRPLGRVATASALVLSANCCHLWGHQSYFPAPRSHSAAPSPRPQGPRVAPACPVLPGGHRHPRPVPLSVLGGPTTCFSGRPGGAYGNSWRELTADVGGLWSCVFCLIWGDTGGPWNPAGWATHPARGSNCHDSRDGSRRGAWMRAPKRVERSGVWGEKRADFFGNLLFRLQLASRPAPSLPPPNASLITFF